MDNCPMKAITKNNGVVEINTDSEEYERMLDIYYNKRDWDTNGIPSEETAALFKGSIFPRKTAKKGK